MRILDLFIPRIRLSDLPLMLGLAALGAVLAGGYGVVHDQVTYTLSPEYFTRLKFAQFDYADFGLPTRVFVAEIGFLATWWVGLFAAWFIARVAVPGAPRSTAVRRSLRGFSIVLATAIAAGIIGFAIGLLHGPDFSAWKWTQAELGVVDLPAFVRVGYIHNAGYSGGLVGLILGIVYLARLKRADRAQP